MAAGLDGALMAPRARKPESWAYVLRQSPADMSWHIVNRSGPSKITGEPRYTNEPTEPLARLEGEDDATYTGRCAAETADQRALRGALEEMTRDAARREEREQVQDPDGHVLIVACRWDELEEFGVRTISKMPSR